MIYKKFVRTELPVSVVSLGTWGIGDAGWGIEEENKPDEAITAL